jgi:phosphatidylglycerol:prolipoprotein diacylglycerol transferase
MHPDLIDIGFLHLKTYGACIAAGFLLCWHIAERLSRRKDLSNLIIALMLSGVIGARAAYVIENWSTEFAAHPLDIVRIDQGGLVFYGGLLLAVAVFFAWCLVKKERIAPLADLLCAVIPLGHAFGRVGCFFYGCCYGRPSASALAVSFPMRSPAWHEQLAHGLISPSALCSRPVLPTQLFEAAALLVLFAVLMLVYRRCRTRPGTVSGVYLTGYALLRFPMEYLRGDPRAEIGPFSIAQTLSFLVLALGIGFLVLPRRRRDKALPQEGS